MTIPCSRRLVVAALLGGGLLSGIGAPRADAALSACRSDPQVTLSNGLRINLASSINLQQGRINGIYYTLHGPVGTTVSNVVYTGGATGHIEHFAYVADQTTNAYVTDTYADTGADLVDTQASTDITGKVWSGPGTGQANGKSNQHLLITLAS